MRRYHPFSFDFDSTPTDLQEPGEEWSPEAKKAHAERREKFIERLKDDYGKRHHADVISNVAELGPKHMSLISYHNRFHQQAREAFIVCAYYPALVGACALGERILNHLMLDLRGSFKTSPHYKKIHRKDSFGYWPTALDILSDWGVFAEGVADDFLALHELRNRSIHFNADTYSKLRDDALSALHLLNKIISGQFGYFGGQPWFIPNTPGAQFVKREHETTPFVKTYILPRSGFVGPYYGMELLENGAWQHLDYADYGDGVLSDEEFAKAHRDREAARVVSREMIERRSAEPTGA